MGELVTKSACEELLPLQIGGVQLSELTQTRMTSLAPKRGQEDALSDVLKGAHGMALPAVNRATGREGARAIWFGMGQVMLIGPMPDVALGAFAAMTDQSDAWAVVRLEGTGAEDVLARLVPLDLRSGSFKRGHTARSQLQHMTVSVTRVGEQAFQIMAFRSMAQTLVHELETAMKRVAARSAS